jgi:hypothetical protein
MSFVRENVMSNLSKILVVLLVVTFAAAAPAITPEYQPVPEPNLVDASGVADATGPGGIAYIEYWVWDGGNGWYYYSYRIYNEAFEPFVKHLTIGNPTGDPYVVTSSSGGGDVGGTPWSAGSHLSLPTLVDWVAGDPNTVVYPGQDSWESPLFQFASQLPPSSARFTVRQGDLSIYANGLIPAPGSSAKPRSAGYWKHQYSGMGNRKEVSSLPDYMDIIEIYSQVFADELSGTISSDLAFAAATLSPVADSSDMLAEVERQLFALWLNVASQKWGYYDSVSFDPEGVTTTATTVQEAIDQIEATILNPAATLEELENAKDMAEILNLT